MEQLKTLIEGRAAQQFPIVLGEQAPINAVTQRVERRTQNSGITDAGVASNVVGDAVGINTTGVWSTSSATLGIPFTHAYLRNIKHVNEGDFAYQELISAYGNDVPTQYRWKDQGVWGAWKTSIEYRLADSALNTANAAKNSANTATATANTAQTAADAAKTAANNANAVAVDAQGKANTADANANSANAKAITAQNTANAALPKSGGTIKGPLNVEGEVITETLLTVKHGDIRINSDSGNSHLWFNGANGAERALIWVQAADGTLNFRSKGGRYLKLESTGTLSVTGVAGSVPAFECPATIPVGAEKAAIVTGQVAGGGWGEWGALPSGLSIGCPQAVNSATNIWKATQWDRAHLAAMAVHWPSNSGCVVSLHVGAVVNAFTFHETGGGTAVGGWHTGSDLRFKEDVKPLSTYRTSWLSKVCALTASFFKYKKGANRSIGFIAQDVREIIPEAISVQVDTTIPEEEREGTERLFIDPMAIIAAQNEAIKELVTRIEALEAK